MRTLLRVALPVAAGLAVLVAALVVPVDRVHGSVSAGPKDATRAEPWWYPAQPIQVAWSDDHRRVAMRVRWGCRPVLLGERSTAPARIEVSLRIDRAAACRVHPVTTTFSLRPPTVTELGQGAMVLIDGARLDLPRYQR